MLGALCGVGGGIVMVPAFVGLLKLAHKQAVTTSLGSDLMRGLSNPTLTRIFRVLLVTFSARMPWKG